ncbi:MAG: hypothetical protein D6820_02860 [Lentisphaerae bacterium]|nr:MAG: hypothetical protein D6820_02860 [Lentisphaerota bacterium]
MPVLGFEWFAGAFSLLSKGRSGASADRLFTEAHAIWSGCLGYVTWNPAGPGSEKDILPD